MCCLNLFQPVFWPHLEESSKNGFELQTKYVYWDVREAIRVEVIQVDRTAVNMKEWKSGSRDE